MAKRDVSDEPIARLEVYRLIEEHGYRVAETVTDEWHEALVAFSESVNKALVDICESVNKALVDVGESRRIELVNGPTSVKKINRDANGNIETIEEFAPVATKAEGHDG